MTTNHVSGLLWMATLLSVTWSASINSILSLRTIKSLETGLSPHLLDSVIGGARLALDNCQRSFKWDRWNCPETAFSRHGRQPSTKETAFLLAITSAGIVHSVTRNCSRGDLEGCGCDPQLVSTDSEPRDVHGTWTWGGCSDYLGYGEQIAQGALTEADNGRDPQAYANLHNNAAGRMAVRATMQKRCRCHGVSGSCSMQTCWMQMATFTKVSDELRVRYDHAQRLDLDPTFNTVGDTDITRDVPVEDLVYLLDSPDYCKTNEISGWPGTKGRSCSRNKGGTISAAERRSCKTLCRSCGHRVRRERRLVTRRCNCSFHWCCTVTCDTCTGSVSTYACA